MSLDLFVQYFLMFAIVFDASIAWFVLLKNPKRAVNQAYFFMMFWIMLWQIVDYNDYFNASEQLLLWTCQLSYFSAAILVVSVVYLAMIFPNKNHKPRSLIWLIIIGLSFAVTAFTNLLVVDVTILSKDPSILYWEFGYFLPYYSFYILIMLICALAIAIIRQFREKDQKAKIQLQYFILGLTIPIIFGSITNLFMPVLEYFQTQSFTSVSLNNIGPASTIFLSALTAYAILRHRLMDIKAVIRRNVIGAVVYVITLGMFFAAGYYIVQRESVTLGLTELGGLTLILAIVLVLAWPLYLGVKRLTRRLIKPQIIDIHKWSDLEQQQLAKVETTEQVARLVAAHFQRVIPVTHYTCVAYNHDQFYEVVYSDLPARKFDVNEPWVKALQEHQHTIISMSISAQNHVEMPAADTRISAIDIHQLSGSTTQRASLQRLADRYQAQFILPLATDDFFIGVLLIGDKINGQPFSAEELRNMEAMRGLATQTLLNVLRLRKLVKTDVTDYEDRLERQKAEDVTEGTTKGIAEVGRKDTEAI